MPMLQSQVYGKNYMRNLRARIAFTTTKKGRYIHRRVPTHHRTDRLLRIRRRDRDMATFMYTILYYGPRESLQMHRHLKETRIFVGRSGKLRLSEKIMAGVLSSWTYAMAQLRGSKAEIFTASPES